MKSLMLALVVFLGGCYNFQNHLLKEKFVVVIHYEKNYQYYSSYGNVESTEIMYGVQTKEYAYEKGKYLYAEVDISEFDQVSSIFILCLYYENDGDKELIEYNSADPTDNVICVSTYPWSGDE